MQQDRTLLEKAMARFTEPRYFKLELFFAGIIVGTLTGVVISAFCGLLSLSEHYRPLMYDWLMTNCPAGFLGWFFVLVVIAFVLARIVKTEGMTSGSGIPQVKGILLGEMHMDNWARVLVLKFVGCVLAIGAGLSFGRASPSVQLGGCVGQGVSRLRKCSQAEERYLLTAGAGAGLAAAFNAPLAGVIFALEEVQKNFSPLVLMASVGAAVTATLVSETFLGTDPVFKVGAVPVVPVDSMYLLLFALGLFVGLLGLGFNRGLLLSLDVYDRTPLSGWQRPIVPLLTAGVLGFVLPEVLGGGEQLVNSLSVTDYGIAFLILLLFAKFFFTMLCFGTGAPGGIFLPLLSLGALGGAIFAYAAVSLGLLDPHWTIDFIVFGMAGYFAAVVKAPVTASVLIMEMTGSFEHMLAVICVSMAAYLVSDLAGALPIYDALLGRTLMIRAKISRRVRRHRVMAEFVVENGSRLAGMTVKSARLPEHTVIVSVRRSGREIAADPALTFVPGDYVTFLADDTSLSVIRNLLRERVQF